ncbi:SDR family NAD(P)-dependent oxidoreductase [Paracoccus sp. p4-l81]|uniref:SDR family NAD(P)-dependent oxidoreductase n=1 Tax=unclassified Paracoccus (in: a-proteobacteria) TaxID=2688777 RepID=UPI0035BA4596
MKTALVTGASRGLGRAIAERLGAEGWQVIAVARTTGALEELDDAIRAKGGAPAVLVPLDLTDPAACDYMARHLGERFGGLDLWVHAAIHATPMAPAGHIDAKDMTKAIATNLACPAHLIPLIEPMLLARQGTALFFDDPAGGEKFFGAYGATKAAQIALVTSWQREAARIGPRVVLARPQPMPTATRARFYPGEDRAPLADPQAEAARILAALSLALPGTDG